MSNSPMRNNVYSNWVNTRIEYLINLLGEDWFKDKDILELAAGHGYVGERLKELGANVYSTDGRKEHVDFLISLGYDAQVLDQDNPWDLKRKFDLIIHWGVLYHLNNHEQDLKCAMQHGDLICLETAVMKNPQQQKENGHDQSLTDVALIPSIESVEQIFAENGWKTTVYEDEKLNGSNCDYVREPQEKFETEFRNSWKNHATRRFWMCENNNKGHN